MIGLLRFGILRFGICGYFWQLKEVDMPLTFHLQAYAASRMNLAVREDDRGMFSSSAAR